MTNQYLYEWTFRFIMYVFFGLTLETFFAVTGIEHCLGHKLAKRTPHRYLEGFVSLYMIPLHGFGILFLYEWALPFVSTWSLIWRYLFWCLTFTTMEILYGFFQLKTLGFYTWDYYQKSRFKVFPQGITLWTLVPVWGTAGLMLEVYAPLMIKLSPIAGEYLKNLLTF
jgi:hypothetical protein